MGELNIYARVESKGVENLIWQLKGNQGVGWREARVPLSQVNEDKFQVYLQISLNGTLSFKVLSWSKCTTANCMVQGFECYPDQGKG